MRALFAMRKMPGNVFASLMTPGSPGSFLPAACSSHAPLRDHTASWHQPPACRSITHQGSMNKQMEADDPVAVAASARQRGIETEEDSEGEDESSDWDPCSLLSTEAAVAGDMHAQELERIWDERLSLRPPKSVLRALERIGGGGAGRGDRKRKGAEELKAAILKKFEHSLLPWLLQHVGRREAHSIISLARSPLALTVDQVASTVQELERCLGLPSRKHAWDVFSRRPLLTGCSPERMKATMHDVMDLFRISPNEAGLLVARQPLLLSLSRSTMRRKIVAFTRASASPNLASTRQALHRQPHLLVASIPSVALKRSIVDEVVAQHKPWGEELLKLSLCTRIRLLRHPVHTFARLRFLLDVDLAKHNTVSVSKILTMSEAEFRDQKHSPLHQKYVSVARKAEQRRQLLVEARQAAEEMEVAAARAAGGALACLPLEPGERKACHSEGSGGMIPDAQLGSRRALALYWDAHKKLSSYRDREFFRSRYKDRAAALHAWAAADLRRQQQT